MYITIDRVWDFLGRGSSNLNTNSFQLNVYVGNNNFISLGQLHLHDWCEICL